MAGDEHFPIDAGAPGERPARRSGSGEGRPGGGGGRGRVPPHNIEAEESVLGALLLSRDAINAVGELGLKPGDFYKPAHRHIFDAVRSLYGSGAPVDVVTVADELRRHSLLDETGGAAALHELQNATPAISSAGHYAKIVQDTAVLRQLIFAAGDIAELAYSEPDDVAKALDEAESKVFRVGDQRSVDSIRMLDQLLPEVLDSLQSIYDRKSKITGIPTGYTDLDELLSGLQENALYIVGARPAMGKCVAFDTPIVDPSTGDVITALEMMERAQAAGAMQAVALGSDGRQTVVDMSHVLADGIKPVFRVRTRSGREVTITATHPLLTTRGWQPLEHIAVGDPIAVPTRLPIFGNDSLPDAEVDLLALLIGDGSISHGRPSPALTAELPEVVAVARDAAGRFGVQLRFDAHAGRAATYRISAGHAGRAANPVTAMLRRHGAWGHNAHQKHIPPAVFRLPELQLARFLNRLFATDGSAWVASAGYARISYCSVSRRLAGDVQHLLLRFGIRANLRERHAKYTYRGAESRRRSYEVEIMDSPSLIAFADRIGILGKDPSVARVRAVAAAANFGFSGDTVPVEVWGDILKAKGALSWGEVNRRAGRPASHNWHPYRGRVRRETVARLAEALDCDQLRWWASPDVLWDDIVAIEPAGRTQVIDFTVPELHNFVAADMYLHNTAFGLGLAVHAAQYSSKPTLVFSLEMAHNELTQRILASEARVDSTKIRTGDLSEAEWRKIGTAIGRLEVPLFLDDNPRVTVMEIRAKARRLKAQYGGLAAIVIDYIQLMGGNGAAENRQLEVSEISRNLKILARELEVPIVALSQLSRNLEARADKRPMLSDLRESGSLEQDADVVMFLYRDEVYHSDSPDKGSAEVIVAKHRAGPIGTKRLVFLGQYTRFDNAARV
jgi:replicative DNA helicase